MCSIAAGIILCKPDLIRLKENIDSIYNQVELVILIDNNSSNIDLIEIEYCNSEKIIIIKNENNLGIAIALNQAMSICQSQGYTWVLTLDQDSVCPSNLMEEYKKYLELPDVAIISPVVYDRNRIKSFSVDNIYAASYELIDKCITSAALTNVAIWKSVGCFDEVMFIDYVDFEYCKRVVLNKYKIIKVNTVVLLHEIGHITQRKFFVREINVMNHSAFRKYYMSKNMLYYAKKYRVSGSVMNAYLGIFKLMLITLLYEQNKWEKIRKIIQGMYDGRKLKGN